MKPAACDVDTVFAIWLAAALQGKGGKSADRKIDSGICTNTRGSSGKTAESEK